MKKSVLLTFLSLWLAGITMAQPERIFYDDFESYEGMVMEAGNWTLLNRDYSDYTYAGFSGIIFKEYPNNGTDKMSFMVMDYSEIDLKESTGTPYSYQGHSGTKSMVSTTPWSLLPGPGSATTYPANTWLISPKIKKLQGSGNTLVFYIRSQNVANYKAKFNVLVAKAQTGDPVKMGEENFSEDRFTLISKNPEQLENYMEENPESRWIRFVYSLDDYVGEEVYIAIQNVSLANEKLSAMDNFISMGFMVDDFEVISGACLEEVRGVFSAGIQQGEALVRWTGDAPLYDIEYGLAGFELGKGTRKTLSSTEFTISGLDDNKTYQYYVRAYCDKDTPSEIWSGFHTLEKLVLPVKITPEQSYLYGFESADLALDGWKIETLATGEGEWVHMVPGTHSFTHQAYEKEGFIRFSRAILGSDAEADSWIISRGLELEEGQEIITSFYLAVPFYKENFKVAIATGNSALAMKQGSLLLEKEEFTNGQYEQFTARFTAEEAGIYYLGFCAYTSGSSGYMWFDYVSVADASIQEEEEDYAVLVEDSFDEGYSDLQSGSIGKLTSLNASGKQKIQGSNLGEGLENASFMVISENTELSDEYDFTAYSGDKSLIVFAAEEGESDDWLITDKLTLGKSGNIVSFWAKAPNKENKNEKFRLMVATEEPDMEAFDSSIFEPVEAEPQQFQSLLIEGAEDNWVKLYYSLDKYAQEEVYIALNYISNAAEGGSALMIDNWRIVQGGWIDESIDEITCPETNIYATSVSISWSAAGAYSYEVEYGEKGFQLGHGTSVSTTTREYLLSELEENTLYDVYIRSWKNEEVASEAWSNPVSFRTQRSPVRVTDGYEFMADFEQEDFTSLGWRASAEKASAWRQVTGDAQHAYQGEGYLMYDNQSTALHAEDYLFMNPLILEGRKEIYFSFYYKTTTPEAGVDLYPMRSYVNSYNATILGENSPVSLIDVIEGVNNTEYKYFETTIYFSLDEQNWELYRPHLGLLAVPMLENVKAQIYIDNILLRIEHAEGIETEEAKAEDLLIYPNPATDYITVVYPNCINTDVAKVTITDMSGRKVKTEKCQSIIHVSELPAGIYTLTISDGLTRIHKVFIKK